MVEKFCVFNGPYSTNGLINAHPLPGGKMAEFANDDTGAYSIASFYEYAVAKYNLYIYWFLKLCTAYSIVCRFYLDFYTTFYTVFVSLFRCCLDELFSVQPHFHLPLACYNNWKHS